MKVDCHLLLRFAAFFRNFGLLLKGELKGTLIAWAFFLTLFASQIGLYLITLSAVHWNYEFAFPFAEDVIILTVILLFVCFRNPLKHVLHYTAIRLPGNKESARSPLLINSEAEPADLLKKTAGDIWLTIIMMVGLVSILVSCGMDSYEWFAFKKPHKPVMDIVDALMVVLFLINGMIYGFGFSLMATLFRTFQIRLYHLVLRIKSTNDYAWSLNKFLAVLEDSHKITDDLSTSWLIMLAITLLRFHSLIAISLFSEEQDTLQKVELFRHLAILSFYLLSLVIFPSLIYREWQRLQLVVTMHFTNDTSAANPTLKTLLEVVSRNSVGFRPIGCLVGPFFAGCVIVALLAFFLAAIEYRTNIFVL